MARKFLYAFAVLIVLVIAGAFAYRLYGIELMRRFLVPSAEFVALPPPAPRAYAGPEMWIARPDTPGNPGLWLPEGYQPATKPPAAVFFIHPTSFLDTATWNAALDNADANNRAAVFVRGQATAFNSAGEIWAPRYRQATFGAFLTSKASAHQALDIAYRDVLAAFGEFVTEAGNRPIILAGHSQGALHLSRLLVDRVAGKPIANQIVAAYIVGWPVSIPADLPKMGLPACATPSQTRCILSWQSFSEPADPSLIVDTFDATSGFTGQPRAGTPMVCTNPLTGTLNAAAPASANLGALIPDQSFQTARMEVGTVPARCEGRGFLNIGATPPNLGQYVLPGNNYHVFDYSLFWANTRRDAGRRLAAFGGSQPPAGSR